MAVKMQAVQTLVDLTDGYTVGLSTDSAAYTGTKDNLGTAQTVVITVSVFQGDTAFEDFTLTANVVSQGGTAATATVGTGTNYNKVTVQIPAAATKSGRVDITVSITNTEIEIVKTFSYSITLIGQTGSPGSPGSPGNPGYSTATVELFKRAASNATVAAPSSVTYTFATGSFEVPATWSRGVPAQTSSQDALWQTIGTATGNGATATMNFETPHKVAEGDAISLTILPDTTVIKNSSSNINLSADIRIGTTPASISSSGVVTWGSMTIGTLKWYKGSSTTGTTAYPCVISPNDINGTLTVTAKLEG